MLDPAIHASNLTKTFRNGMVAVNGFDLRVSPGAVYGLIGRNGAGKSTALRLLMGLLRPDKGTAQVLGWNLWNAPREVRARIAYVSQTQQLHGWMRLDELCRYTSHFYDSWDLTGARRLAGDWGLDWERPVGAMSSGEQRKVGLLLAFASRPEVLLLDEPVASLDPVARREIIDGIVSLLSDRPGLTVLLSTHQINDLERIAEYIGVMDRGRIVLSERLEDLQASVKRVQIIFPGSDVPPDFSISGALRERRCGPVATAIVRLAAEGQLDFFHQMPGVRVNAFPLGLEELFLELFGHEPKAAHDSPSVEMDIGAGSEKILPLQQC